MSDSYGKRQREPSDDGGRPIKREASNKMVEDFLESMDPSVRIKLRSMFDDGLLMYSDLDERNIAELSKFDASVALEILEHYCSGDLTQVRNRRAYLAGAIKRRVHMVRDSYEPTPLAPDGMPLLVQEVQRKFDQVKAMSPKVAELDQRSLDALAAMPPSRALAALDRFGSMDFSAVRNPSALFMSIVRTIMEAPPDSGSHRPPMGGGYRPAPIYGPPAAPPPPPPPPPPRRPPPQYAAAAAGGFPPGTIITPGPGGGLVIAGTGLVGGIAGLPAALPTVGGIGAAASGLVLAAAPGAGGVPQYMLVNTSAAQGVAGGVQVVAPQAGQVLAAPQVINMQPQQQAAPSVQAVQAAAPQAAAAVPEGVPPDWAAGRKNHGTEQGQLGVRVSEFHDLSPFAVYVHPSPALKLQQLWDNGNELVSMLDDKVWQVLAEMPAPEGLAAIQEAADALDNPDSTIRSINAFFMSVVKKVWHQQGMQPRGAAGTSSGPGSGDYYSQQRGPPRGPYGGRGGGGGRGSGDWGSEGGGQQQQQQHHHSREPAIHLLPPEQRLLAQSLCKTHAPLLREDHFDEGVIDSLRRLSHEEGIAVLHELGHNSMSGVRNMPAYIMGIAKRYATGQRGPAGRVQQPHEVVI